MGMSGDTALTLAKNYVKKTLQGQGALKGQDGFSPIVTENKDNTDEIYKLDITTKDGTFTTPNLKGFIGADGFSPIATVTKVGNTTTITLTDKNGTTSEMIMDGETNIIESITVNGVAVPISDKTVNIDLSGYVEKEDGKTLVSASDVSQIRKNKDDIATLNGTGDGSVDKKIADKLSEQTYLTKKIITADEASAYIADPHTAKFNIIYLVKDESASGSDKYFEYQRIGTEESSTFEMTGDTSTNLADYAKSAEIPTTVAELTDSADYAKKTDIPTTLPADGGNADTVNNHTVESDVPVDAKFTDTVYDDTEVKGSIEEVNSNLDELSYSDNGIENLCNPNKIERGLYTSTDTRVDNYFHYEIEVTPNEYYSRTRFDGLTDYSGYCFSVLDENKNCIVVFANNERTIQIPSNGAYLWLQGGESAEQLKNMKYMVVRLQTPPTVYKPYIPSVKMIAEEVSAQNESLSVIGKCKNLLNPTLQTTTLNGVTCTNNGDGTYTLNGTATSEVALYLIDNDNIQIPKGMYKTICSTDDNIKSAYYFSNKGWISDNQFEITQSDILSGMWIKVQQDYTCDNVIIKPMLTTDLNATYDDFVPYTGDGETLTHDVADLKNNLAPKKIELQNVDERVTIQDNGSFIINGFAFVNLLVTFNETLPQWSNFVRLPRPKGDDVPVHCENSVRFTIYSQDNLPGDCGTYENVASGTEIRLLVNYEVA